jgi:UDP-N-acetylglucosamine--dolichyl-phosphate N-acetylglucosaminephosphotransferase
LKTFYFKSSENLIEIFAILTVILIVSFIGLIDDVLGWKIGLNKKTRLFFLLFASIPLIVINIGESRVIGMEIGLIYPLILIPIGIIATSSTFNFLAGYNGLESSQGILILSGLTFVCYRIGNSWLSLIGLIMIASLFSFYLFNKYPAKILPGDSLTYSIGALIGIMAIVGNIEKVAIFFYIPYILEVGLKVRGKLKKESFAKLNERGGLEIPYEKFYGLEHIAVYLLKRIKKEKLVKENEVVLLINLFQIAIILIGLLIFKEAIFI